MPREATQEEIDAMSGGASGSPQWVRVDPADIPKRSAQPKTARKVSREEFEAIATRQQAAPQKRARKVSREEFEVISSRQAQPALETMQNQPADPTFMGELGKTISKGARMAGEFAGAGAEMAGQMFAAQEDVLRQFPSAMGPGAVPPPNFDYQRAAQQVQQAPTPNPLLGTYKAAQQQFQSNKPDIQPAYTAENTPYLGSSPLKQKALRLIGEAGPAAATMAPVLGGAVVAGPLGAGAVGTLVNAAAQYGEALDRGETPEVAMRQAMVYAPMAGALDAIPFAEKALRFLPDAAAKSVFTNIAARGGLEGITEMLQGGASSIAEEDAIPKTADEFKAALGRAAQGVVDEGSSFVIAALMGGAMTAPTSVRDARNVGDRITLQKELQAGADAFLKDYNRQKLSEKMGNAEGGGYDIVPAASIEDALQAEWGKLLTPDIKIARAEENAQRVIREREEQVLQAAQQRPPGYPLPERAMGVEPIQTPLVPGGTPIDPGVGVVPASPGSTEPILAPPGEMPVIPSQEPFAARRRQPMAVAEVMPANAPTVQPFIGERPIEAVEDRMSMPTLRQPNMLAEPVTARRLTPAEVARADFGARTATESPVEPPALPAEAISQPEATDTAPEQPEATQRPTAQFLAWQDRGKRPPVALYNIPVEGGGMSTVTADTARERGFDVPEPDVPPPGQEQPATVVEAEQESISDPGDEDAKLRPRVQRLTDRKKDAIVRLGFPGTPMEKDLIKAEINDIDADIALMKVGLVKDSDGKVSVDPDNTKRAMQWVSDLRAEADRLEAELERADVTPTEEKKRKQNINGMRLEANKYERQLSRIRQQPTTTDIMSKRREPAAEGAAPMGDTNAAIGRMAGELGMGKGGTEAPESPRPWEDVEYETMADESRFYGTKVIVTPRLRGADPWVGTIHTVLNGGNLLEVHPDSATNDPIFTLRIPTEQVTATEVVDSGATKQEAPQPQGVTESPAKPADAERLNTTRQMLLDNMQTKRGKRETIPEAWLRMSAEIESQLSGVEPVAGAIAGGQVFGHPQATNILPAKYGNLIPIKTSRADAVSSRIDQAQSLLDELQSKIATSEYKAKTGTPKEKREAKSYLASTQHSEDETIRDLLRQETIPELSRMLRLLQTQTQQQPTSPAKPSQAFTASIPVPKGSRPIQAIVGALPSDVVAYDPEKGTMSFDPSDEGMSRVRDAVDSAMGSIKIPKGQQAAYDNAAGLIMDKVFEQQAQPEVEAPKKRATKPKQQPEPATKAPEAKETPAPKIGKRYYPLDKDGEPDKLASPIYPVTIGDNTYEVTSTDYPGGIGKVWHQVGDEGGAGTTSMPKVYEYSRQSLIDRLAKETPAPKPKSKGKKSDEAGYINLNLGTDMVKRFGKLMAEKYRTGVEFTRGLPLAVKRANVARLGEISRLTAEAEQAVADLRKAWRDYNSAGKEGIVAKGKAKVEAMPKELKDNILNYLDAPKERKQTYLNAIPEPLRDGVVRMRESVDVLSRRLREEGMVSNQMAEIIEAQEGIYLRRTYRIFNDNEKWKGQITEKMKQALRERIASEYELPLGSTAVEEILNRYINIADNMDSDLLRRTSKLGKADVTSLKKRGEFWPEVLDIWGVEQDYEVVYLQTVTSQANLLANRRFQQKVLEWGQGKFIFTKEQRDAHKKAEKDRTTNGLNAEYARLTSTNALEMWEDNASLKDRVKPSEHGTYGPLAGTMVDKEFKKAMLEAMELLNDDGVMGKAMDELAVLNMWIKSNWTVTSWPTTALNFGSNIWISYGNNHLSGGKEAVAKRAMRAAKIAYTEINRTGGKSERETANRLRELKVIGDTVGAGELRSLLGEASRGKLAKFGGKALTVLENMEVDISQKMTGKDTAAIKTIAKMFGVGWDKAVAIYQAGDDFWKANAWLSYMDQLPTLFPDMSRAEIEQMAATFVRQEYPTYSELAKIVQLIRRIPVAGPFLAFPMEMYRTSLNSALRSAYFYFEGKRTGNKAMEDLGKQRILKLAASMVGPMAVTMTVAMMRDLDDDEQEVLREASGPWNKNSTLFPTSLNKTRGTATLDNFSDMVPYAVVTDHVNAIMRAESWPDAFAQVALQFAEPFIQPEPVANYMNNILNNQDDNGNKLFLEGDSLPEIVLKGVAQAWKEMKPGNAKAYEKAMKSDTPVWTSVNLLTGRRQVDVDLPKSLFFKAVDFADAGKEQNSDIYKGIKANDKAEIRKQYRQRVDEYKRQWRDTRDFIVGMQKFGVSHERIVKALDDAGLSKKERNKLINGYYVEPKMPDWVLQALMG